MARFKENAGEVNPACVMCPVGRQHDSDINLPDLSFGAAFECYGILFFKFLNCIYSFLLCVGGHMPNMEDALWE